MDDDDFDADIQRALELSCQDAHPPPPPPVPEVLEEPVVKVVSGFKCKFRVYAAAAVGRADLDATGRILLPHSCLTAIASHLGELPATLLLRLVGSEGAQSTCYVGVAEFIPDEESASMLAKVAGPLIREQQLPRVFDRVGPVAGAVVPRWVRGALLLDPMAPECSLQVISLPKACFLQLRPHTDEFAAELAAAGSDVRATLTELINRFPAISRGRAISLDLGGHGGGGHGGSGGHGGGHGGGGQRRHQLDVIDVRGLPGTRCGMPADAASASGGSGGGGDAPLRVEKGMSVEAACLVDADVEIEFAPSVAAEVAKEAEARQREAAAARADAAATRRAQERGRGRGWRGGAGSAGGGAGSAGGGAGGGGGGGGGGSGGGSGGGAAGLHHHRASHLGRIYVAASSRLPPANPTLPPPALRAPASIRSTDR